VAAWASIALLGGVFGSVVGVVLPLHGAASDIAAGLGLIAGVALGGAGGYVVARRVARPHAP
jgi:hypothetical protein